MVREEGLKPVNKRVVVVDSDVGLHAKRANTSFTRADDNDSDMPYLFVAAILTTVIPLRRKREFAMRHKKVAQTRGSFL